MDVEFTGIKNNQEIKEKLSSISVDKKLPPAKQSANTLFHFLDNFRHLTNMLDKKCIYPRYCEEAYDFLPDKFPHLIFPMKCFCDIYLEKLDLHCRDYGYYGIGFKRDEMINKGIQPIQYVNEESFLKTILYKAAENWIEEHDSVFTEEFYSSDLFCHLRYSKQLALRNTSDENVTYNKFLPDEKEWRYVPTLTQLKGAPLFLTPGIENNEKQKRSDDIERHQIAGLYYEYDYINYLIVPSSIDKV